MRDVETIDGELRLLSRVWRVAREIGCAPSTAHLDQLLTERAEVTAAALRPCSASASQRVAAL
ncbi:hypothetical protein [Mycobacterium sp. 1245805.9]|uniref:hypothetical protein n=1 Tax=Mycobacterium sp. 1245805.9 TaxID=1856862 RepID=UPI0007FD91AF|nr:hypothetical protein [Mycobacterium sp. 1245805.9]OBI82699.1 hypothetical protein A9X00_07055 [Mycobacterium sp. 1245805.9]